MTWLTIVVWSLVCIAAVLIRRREGSWYSPASFFVGTWTVLSGVPIVAGPIAIQPSGLLFVLGESLAVIAGAEAARHFVPAGVALSRNWVDLPLLEWAIVACTVLGLATVVIDLGSRGQGPQVFMSISALAKVARDFSIARYSGAWQEPLAARLLVTSTYIGALLCGVLLATKDAGWSRWASLVVLLPSAMLAALLTTKSSLLLPLVLLAVSYVATSLALQAEMPRVGLRQAMALAAVAIALGGLFVLVQMERYSYTTSAQAVIVMRRFSVDLFAYLGAFSDWLQRAGWSSIHPTWGRYTFAGLFELLHLAPRSAGLYTDQLSIDGEPFNIYTAFRGLIEDFTLPGALVVMAVVGFGAQVAHAKARSGRRPYIALLAAFYAFTLWSFVVNIFIYNTILLAFALLAGYLYLTQASALTRLAVVLDLPWMTTRGQPKVGGTQDRRVGSQSPPG